jgi:SAM-dependent methyltransferase
VTASSSAEQAALWNKKHGADEHAAQRGAPLPFGHDAAEFFSPESYILEIGCGVGADAAYFADQGHHVIATDVSSVVIDQNKSYYAGKSIDFRQLDATQPLPFNADEFDVVYSHLALHYFDHATTTAIFAELARVLKPGGILAFACKSIHDSKYGEGEEVEPDMFVRKGHVRHFFSLDYTRQLLEGGYESIEIGETEERYAGQVSSMIHCIARKCSV